MIKLDNVDKMYKDKKVLSNVTLTFQTNEKKIYGLIGPNGAGKTSLLKSMSGILEYSAGKILHDGEAVDGKWLRKNIVFIPTGERGLRYRNTVHDNVMFFGAMKGCAQKTLKENMKIYAKMLKFESFMERKVESLSTGEKRKAILLCGLCTEASILILDEPSNGLDIDTQRELQETLCNVNENSCKTIIISSHELDFLCGIVNQYIFIMNGEIKKEIEGNMEIEEVKKIYFSLREEAAL